MRAAGKKVTRKERECATAQQHHEAAREPWRPWFEWKKLCMCRICVQVRGEALERALAGP
jgi:hypothetical protein